MRTWFIAIINLILLSYTSLAFSANKPPLSIQNRHQYDYQALDNITQQYWTKTPTDNKEFSFKEQFNKWLRKTSLWKNLEEQWQRIEDWWESLSYSRKDENLTTNQSSQSTLGALLKIIKYGFLFVILFSIIAVIYWYYYKKKVLFKKPNTEQIDANNIVEPNTIDKCADLCNQLLAISNLLAQGSFIKHSSSNTLYEVYLQLCITQPHLAKLYKKIYMAAEQSLYGNKAITAEQLTHCQAFQEQLQASLQKYE